jgi:hypothetical protein
MTRRSSRKRSSKKALCSEFGNDWNSPTCTCVVIYFPPASGPRQSASNRTSAHMRAALGSRSRDCFPRRTPAPGANVMLSAASAGAGSIFSSPCSGCGRFAVSRVARSRSYGSRKRTARPRPTAERQNSTSRRRRRRSRMVLAAPPERDPLSSRATHSHFAFSSTTSPRSCQNGPTPSRSLPSILACPLFVCGCDPA